VIVENRYLIFCLFVCDLQNVSKLPQVLVQQYMDGSSVEEAACRLSILLSPAWGQEAQQQHGKHDESQDREGAALATRGADAGAGAGADGKDNREDNRENKVDSAPSSSISLKAGENLLAVAMQEAAAVVAANNGVLPAGTLFLARGGLLLEEALAAAAAATIAVSSAAAVAGVASSSSSSSSSPKLLQPGRKFDFHQPHSVAGRVLVNLEGDVVPLGRYPVLAPLVPDFAVKVPQVQVQVQARSSASSKGSASAGVDPAASAAPDAEAVLLKLPKSQSGDKRTTSTPPLLPDLAALAAPTALASAPGAPTVPTADQPQQGSNATRALPPLPPSTAEEKMIGGVPPAAQESQPSVATATAAAASEVDSARPASLTDPDPESASGGVSASTGSERRKPSITYEAPVSIASVAARSNSKRGSKLVLPHKSHAGTGVGEGENDKDKNSAAPAPENVAEGGTQATSSSQPSAVSTSNKSAAGAAVASASKVTGKATHGPAGSSSSSSSSSSSKNSAVDAPPAALPAALPVAALPEASSATLAAVRDEVNVPSATSAAGGIGIGIGGGGHWSDVIESIRTGSSNHHLHLIVLQHGFLGGSYDMQLIDNSIRLELPGYISVWGFFGAPIQCLSNYESPLLYF
jgi:hypothetical protein